MRLWKDIDKDWVYRLSKITNKNGCWIKNDLATTHDGYVTISIDSNRYYLSRLVLCIFNDLRYEDIFDTRHKIGCDTRCFNPEHLTKGSHRDNVIDSVNARTHVNASKDVCPTCGRPFKTRKIKTGYKAGRLERFCRTCKNEKQRKYRETHS